MLAKGQKWWRLPHRPSRFTIAVKEDIDVQPFITRTGSELLAVRHLTDYLQDYFAKEQPPHAVG
jgi:hypothetical protein